MYPPSKKFNFSKYQAHGNDFIIIDDRELVFPLNQKFILEMCSRHFGIGADGFIALQKSSSCDFKMRIFNEDSSEASMCGNGIRCLAHFIYTKTGNKTFSIETLAGSKYCRIFDEDIEVDIGSVKILEKIELGNCVGFLVDSGVPHAVIYVPSVFEIDVAKIGQEIRGLLNANVTFVELSGKIRTYERGLERESFSCGTGACAAAKVLNFFRNAQQSKSLSWGSLERQEIGLLQNLFRGKNIIDIYTRSGKLSIYLDDFFCKMSGPVKHVFDGQY